MKIILASQSEARKRLLARLLKRKGGGELRFTVSPADLDEDAIAEGIRDPKKVVRKLAQMKAQTVFSSAPDSLVIGSDQVLVSDGKIFGKPHTPQRARAQLRAFSGKDIDILTGVCVLSPGSKAVTFVHRTRMKFRKLSDKEIAQYVRIDQPLWCAGSFKFESYGISLFESVRTDDPTAIEGLPVLRLAKILRDLGAI